MGLLGKYINTLTGEILEITEANDINGQLSGSLTVTVGLEKRSMNVSGHYHYSQNNQPQTYILLQSAVDDGNPGIYEAWAGVAMGSDYQSLELHGGRGLIYNSGETVSQALSGPFVRV